MDNSSQIKNWHLYIDKIRNVCFLEPSRIPKKQSYLYKVCSMTGKQADKILSQEDWLKLADWFKIPRSYSEKIQYEDYIPF